MEINNDILVDFFNGKLNREEQQEVEQWYLASEENQKTLEQLYYILFVSDRIKVEKEIDTERSLKELKERIGQKENSPVRKNKPGHKIHWMRYAVAVVFIGIISIGTISLINISERLSKPFIATTNLGERAQITLPDGTKVWLNACSKVEYTSSLFSRKRNVNMTGEVYFEVEHSKNAPFTVTSRNLNTTVLGTKFNIRSNEDEPYITTTLLEGSILITSEDLKNEGIKLKPNQQLYYNLQTSKAILSNCTTAEDNISWIDNRLIFEDTSLLEITKSLERHYNVQFIFKDKELEKERFTFACQTTENIYQILSVLKLTDKFDYTINDRTVTLFRR